MNIHKKYSIKRPVNLDWRYKIQEVQVPYLCFAKEKKNASCCKVKRKRLDLFEKKIHIKPSLTIDADTEHSKSTVSTTKLRR